MTDQRPPVVKERILLPGWDPDEPVPAFTYRPQGAADLPMIIFLHGLGRDKERFASRLPAVAEAGFLVVAIDAYLHGERREPSVFPPHVGDLRDSLAVWVHQTCISHTARDVSRIIDHLGELPGTDASRVGVAGSSMGGGTALVAAARDARVSAVVALIAAADGWWDVTKTPPGPAQDALRADYSPRLRQLVDSLDPLGHVAAFCPRPVLLLSAGLDRFIDPRSVEEFARRLKDAYGQRGERVAFFLEPQAGHEVTDLMWARTVAWFQRHLQGKNVSVE
jgi:dienelactone hydrolase